MTDFLIGPRVTVLMPVYNASPYLGEAIESILNQTYTDFVFLIINDGSTDNSEDVILSYNDTRIRYVKNAENAGLVKTLNLGLDMIETEYMVRMDADDVSLPDRIMQLKNFMDKNPNITVCGSFIEVFGKQEDNWVYPLEDASIKAGLFFGSIMPHAASIFRMPLFNFYGVRYSDKFPHMEDQDLWARIFNYAKFANIPVALYRYRILDHNVTQVNASSKEERVIYFFSELFSQLGVKLSEEEIQTFYADFDLKDYKIDNLSFKLSILNKLKYEGIKLGMFSNSHFIDKVKSVRNKLIFIAIDRYGFLGMFNKIGFDIFKPRFIRYAISKKIHR